MLCSISNFDALSRETSQNANNSDSRFFFSTQVVLTATLTQKYWCSECQDPASQTHGFALSNITPTETWRNLAASTGSSTGICRVNLVLHTRWHPRRKPGDEALLVTHQEAQDIPELISQLIQLHTLTICSVLNADYTSIKCFKKTF